MRRLSSLLSLLLPALTGCFRESEPSQARELAVENEQAQAELEVVEGVGTHGWAVPPGDLAAELAGPAGEPVAAPCGVEGLEGCAPGPVDVDADGVTAELDCDDIDPTVSPLAHDIPCNGADENCNDVDDCDRDGDGFRDVDDPEPEVPAAAPARRASEPPRWP